MNKGMWLGFFFFVALVLLLFGSLSRSSIRFAKPIKIKFNFDRVEGLRTGDDIRVEGFKVGQVHEIELRDEFVRVVGHLDHPISVHDDCEVYVESFTLLGNNHISIKRGTTKRPLIPDGTPIKGTAKLSALDVVAHVLSENRTLISDMLASVKSTADEAKALVQALRTGEGTIPRLINDPKIFDGLLKTVEEFRQLAEKANSGPGTLSKLINDPTLYDELKATLTDIRAASASARQMMDKMTAGQGLIGKMINDPKLAEDFEKTMENIRKSSEDFKKIIGRIAAGEGDLGKAIMEEKLVKKAEATLDSADQLLGRASRARVIVGGNYRVFRDSDFSTSRLYLRIAPDETKYFQGGVAFLGLSATGEPIVFDEQLQSGDDDLKAVAEIVAFYKIPWFFDNHVGLRVGLLEGKPGGAVDIDFNLGDWPLTASFEVRDAYGHVDDEDIDENVRGPMTRAYLTAPLWAPGAEAWWKQIFHAVKVTVGMSRLQDDPEFFLGAGFEFEDKDIRTLITLIGLR
jgi:phospholipid/cholesterol/gamma-HCH transport system substrate-binding protein